MPSIVYKNYPLNVVYYGLVIKNPSKTAKIVIKIKRVEKGTIDIAILTMTCNIFLMALINLKANIILT